ncbi:GntR family transcriptional regulator [Vibrio sp. JC009]|uniref:GntR family transcriptional regulator n=1 Tax=Vibrio sp. JC009 TaxID=2912314 RepID=UPI0023B1D53A|nr:GntR family transcriptional regulator [Vibrio sp. JC009]WED23651.1 GntR family transcriptional regulator [Vibrio sp. JC009]
MIDKHSPIPIYLQIEQLLTEKITKGELQPGDMLPSEPEMTELYGVSRMTIRKAVDYLVRQGVVERQRGRGTFVAQPRAEFKMSLPLDKHLTSSEVAEFMNAPIQNKLLHLSKEKADEQVAEALKVEVGTPVWYMTRLRLIRDVPFVYESTHMLYDPFEDLTEEALNGSKYLYVSGHGLEIMGSQKQLRAELPNQEVRNHLGLRRDEPVLNATSVAFLKDNIPFEVSKIYYNQEYYTFTLSTDR